MALNLQMVHSGAVILAWVDNDPRVCDDAANVEFHVVFERSEQVPDSPGSFRSPASAGFR